VRDRKHVVAVVLVVSIWGAGMVWLLASHRNSIPPARVAAPSVGEAPLNCASGTYPTGSGCQPLTPLAATGRPDIITQLTIPGTTVSYYDISGSTPAEIVEQVQKRGPGVDPDPVTGHAGAAAYSLSRSNYRISSTGLCGARIELQQAVTVPRLAPGPTLSDADVRFWNLLMQVIALHEGRHVYITWATVRDYQPEGSNPLTCSAGKTDGAALTAAVVSRNADYHAALRADCVPEQGCLSAWPGP